MAEHRHSWVVEQQTDHRFCGSCGKHEPPDARCEDRPSGLFAMLTGPHKCPDCGTWWTGSEHRCPPSTDTGWVVRPYVGPVSSGGTTAAPWCGICQGWHIPGAGLCTATYS